MAFLPTIRTTLRRSVGEACEMLKSSLTHVLYGRTVSDEILYGFRRDRVADERTAAYIHQRGSQGPVPAYSELLPAMRTSSQLTGRHHQPQGETVDQKFVTLRCALCDTALPIATAWVRPRR